MLAHVPAQIFLTRVQPQLAALLVQQEQGRTVLRDVLVGDVVLEYDPVGDLCVLVTVLVGGL